MTPTRVDTKKLRNAVTLAVKKLAEAVDALEPYLAVLPDAERATVPRVRSDFPSAARKLAVESDKHGDIVSATEYDAEAVIEDLDNVEALAVLAVPLARLQRLFVRVHRERGDRAPPKAGSTYPSPRLGLPRAWARRSPPSTSRPVR